MKKLLYLFIVLCVLASAILPVQWQVGNWEMGAGEAQAGNTTTIQPSSYDTFILEDAATTNYGTQVNLGVNSYTGARDNSLIEFDLSSIPSGATISSSTLSLYYYLYLVADPSGRTITVYRLRRADWSETQATWNIYKTSNNWGTAGAYNTSTDIDTSLTATSTVPGTYGWMTWTVTSLVQDAIDNQSKVLRLKLCDLGASVSKYTLWASREHATTAWRPKIEITYKYPVTVSTLTTTDISPAEATLNGNVTDDKSQTIDYQAFVWDTVSRADPGDLIPSSSLYANNWISAVGDYGEVAFDHLITCLTGNTTYYVRAAAHSAQYNTWSYGGEGNFTTDPSLFTIHTDTWADVSQVRAAIVNGQRYISTLQGDDHIRIYEGNSTWDQGDLVTTSTFHTHDFRCTTYDSIPNKIVFSGRWNDETPVYGMVATYDVVTDTWVYDLKENAPWVFTGDEHDGYIYSLAQGATGDWLDSMPRCTPGNITTFANWEHAHMPTWSYGGNKEFLFTIFGDYMYFNRHDAESYEWQNFKWNFGVSASPAFGDGNWTLIDSSSDSTEAPEDAIISYITANDYMVTVTNPYYNGGSPYWLLRYSTDGVTWGNITTMDMQASVTDSGWWEHFAIPTPYGPNAVFVQMLTEGKTTGYYRIFDLDGNILFCASGRTSHSASSDGNFLVDGDKFVLSSQNALWTGVQFSYLTQLYPPYFSNSPSTIALGTIYGSNTWYAHGNLTVPSFPLADGNCTFQLDNDATIAITIDAYATDATGGAIYYLTDGVPGENEIRLTLLETGASSSTDGIVLSNTGQEFIASIAISGHTHWEFKLETWSSNTDEVEKTVIIYLSSDEIVETVTVTFTPEQPDISNTPSSHDFGIVQPNSTYWANGWTGSEGGAASGNATFYPDYHEEVNSFDGGVDHVPVVASWEDLHDASAATDGTDEWPSASTYFMSAETEDTWECLERGVLVFYTGNGSIPAGATIVSATLSLYGDGKVNTLNISPTINVFSVSPASNTEITLDDYGAFGTTPFSTAINYDDYNASGWNDFVLNEDGLAVVNVGNYTYLGIRDATYDAPDVEPEWSYGEGVGGGYSAGFGYYTADWFTQSYGPKLVIEYTTPNWPLADGNCTGNVTNNSSFAVNILFSMGNMTGGTQWTIGANPGSNIFRMRLYISGAGNSTVYTALSATPVELISDLAADASEFYEFAIDTPTNDPFPDGVEKSGNMTLTAEAA